MREPGRAPGDIGPRPRGHRAAVRPTWTTTQRKDLKYSLVPCTAEGASCSGAGGTGLGVNYEIPLPPGATRTVTVTCRIAAGSGCNGNIGFSSYLHHEYDNGRSIKEGIFTAPDTRVVRPPTTPAAS
ncbi:hypothetical protein ACFU5O_14435 [Streptomyces sp. NPDC057445]|uniref:hypothetical protein n=1 Tax=Streptomyces sp. NPDC057445 TaxID=3346136 RepID=UPI0036A35D4A